MTFFQQSPFTIWKVINVILLRKLQKSIWWNPTNPGASTGQSPYQSTKAGIPIRGVMYFFHGDGPAMQFEADDKVGDHYSRVGCEVHSSRIDDLAYCFHANHHTLAERQEFILRGEVWKPKTYKSWSKYRAESLPNPLCNVQSIERLWSWSTSPYSNPTTQIPRLWSSFILLLRLLKSCMPQIQIAHPKLSWGSTIRYINTAKSVTISSYRMSWRILSLVI